jgi:hypothetical protein
MTLEYIDAFSIFMAGFALGLIGAHYLNKHELKLSYDRGVMDTVWAIQVHGMREHLALLLGTTRDKTADRADGGKGPV